MALPKDFPKSPHAILDPNKRWFPDQKTLKKDYALIPPLVHKIRLEVKKWRDRGYDGVSDTTRALLNFWFKQEHWIQKSDGSFFEFKYDLLKYDSSGLISEKNFDEDWSRL